MKNITVNEIEVQAEIIKSSPGHSWASGFEFKAISPRKLSETEIHDVQIKLGYHPAGYGQRKAYHSVENDIHTTIWGCWGHCE